MPSSRAASKKQHQIELLAGALHGYVRGYKAWLHDALRREKLTLPQLRLLHAIEEGEGESAASIARNLMVTPQTLQTMLERAVRERWIVRTHAAGNQRVLTATLTARGLAVLAQGKALSAQFDRQIWSGIGTAALQQCADTLSRGVANLESLRAAETAGIPTDVRSKQTGGTERDEGAGRSERANG